MRPQKNDDALVDVLDVLLRDGAILRADVIVSVADIPLVGIKLTAAIAGMETMTEYGLFEEWDATRRNAAVSRRQYDRSELDEDPVRRTRCRSLPRGRRSPETSRRVDCGLETVDSRLLTGEGRPNEVTTTGRCDRRREKHRYCIRNIFPGVNGEALRLLCT